MNSLTCLFYLSLKARDAKRELKWEMFKIASRKGEWEQGRGGSGKYFQQDYHEFEF